MEKWLVKLTTSTSGSDWSNSYYENGELINNTGANAVEQTQMSGWYTITWKYYRTEQGDSKCKIFLTKTDSETIINEFEFNIPQEIGLNRYIWPTSTESGSTTIMPMTIKNQKIILN